MNILMPWQRTDAKTPATANELKSTIRWMVSRDLPQIMRIERESFEFNWSEDDFRRAMTHRNMIGLVLERDKQVIGYLLYEIQPTVLTLMNVAVAPEQRRTGVGRAMLESLKKKLDVKRVKGLPRRKEIIATVRETNLECQLWLRACGFMAVGVLQREYFDTDEDAYRFRYVVPAAAREAA